jgi:O-methyltransferase involved in polyketide biosynthesis
MGEVGSGNRATDKVDVRLGKVESTLLWTVHHKVLDFRNTEPVLGDVWAVDVMDRLEFDRRHLRGTSGDRYMVLLRARRIDAWVREWIAANPGGTVLQLACGLDARALRVGAPERGRWIDTDLPDVVALRRRVLPEPPRYRLLAGSATESDWLEEVPTDAPVLVVAEGLVEYLRPEETHALLGRLLVCFPGGGEMVFDVVSPHVGRLAGVFGWQMYGLEDPRLPERWYPGLSLTGDYEVVGDHASVPEQPFRSLYRVLSRWPWTRGMMRVLRFRF